MASPVEGLLVLMDHAVATIWGYFGVPALILLGLYFSFRSRLVQIRRLPNIIGFFRRYWSLHKGKKARGLPPLQILLTEVSGCIGLGNVVGICTAVQLGGPGAIFWVWLTALLGMLVKYSEVFLGVKYRQKNCRDGYSGGPAFYLTKAFSVRWPAILSSILLCIYGIAGFSFSAVVDAFVFNWELNRVLVVGLLLGLVVLGVGGGLKRAGQISSVILPSAVLLFLGMTLWVLFLNIDKIPTALATVFSSAFKGHAAIGGFSGSTIMMAIRQGVSWGCYSGDIGIGSASVIHSATSETRPQKQAALAIMGIFLDTFVMCTLSLSLITVTGTWSESIPNVLLVQTSLGRYIPYMYVFIPILFFLLGYSTVISYFMVGLKNAEFLGGDKGRGVYRVYGLVMLPILGLLGTDYAAHLMQAAGGLLLIINVTALFRLRQKITFDI